MPRGIAAMLALFCWGAVCVAGVRIASTERAPEVRRCDDYLLEPAAGWVALEGCRLDVREVILEAEGGVFETLAHRREGISSEPLHDPVWISTWLPLRSEGNSGRPRVFYRDSTSALMTWVNALERADAEGKARLWADPAPLRRIANPSELAGKAERLSNPALSRAMGTLNPSPVLSIRAGRPAPLSGKTVLVGLFFAVLGVWLTLSVFRHGLND